MLNEQNITGPGRFIFNLERGLFKRGVRIERRMLGRCRCALIISSAPRSFYSFCQSRKIQTLLRVDGFSLPMLYDNKHHTDRMLREMTPARIRTNQQVQTGLARSTHVVYQSEFSREMANTYLFNRVDGFSIIHNGVDHEVFKPVKKGVNPIPVLSVHGTLRDPDIVICVLQAFRMLSETRKVAIRFLGTMKREVEKAVQTFVTDNPHLKECVSWTGTLTIDELPQRLANCDISLHLTSGDWCPNAVLESLSCGLPVICQSWGGTKELVGDGGIVVDVEPYRYDENYASEVAAACETVLADYANYSHLARMRAVDRFSLERMAEKYAVLLASNKDMQRK